MAIACTNVTNVVRSVHLLRIDGYSITKAMGSDCWIKSRWNVGGYEWGVHVHPSRSNIHVDCKPWVALKLIFVGVMDPRGTTPNVEASLRCRLVDPRGTADPSEEKSIMCRFNNRPKRESADSSNPVYLMSIRELEASCYLKDDSFTVQCTVTVLKDLAEVTIRDHEPLPVPSSSLHQHLGELLWSGKAADVEFIVSGESLVAHKNILAARSPVLMAEFFGHMREASSRVVVIEDMEAAAFKAMLHFIYTDTVPAELDGQGEGEGEAATSMAQHLLAAADRYGLDRLKLICVNKLFSCITADNAVAILVLADQHNCSQLKAKCAEFLFNTLPRC